MLKYFDVDMYILDILVEFMFNYNISVPLSLSPCLSVYLSLYISLCFSLSLTLSLSLSPSLSLSLSLSGQGPGRYREARLDRKYRFYEGASDIQREFNENSTRFIVIHRGGRLGQVQGLYGAGVPTASQRSLGRDSVAELGPGTHHDELR